MNTNNIINNILGAKPKCDKRSRNFSSKEFETLLRTHRKDLTETEIASFKKDNDDGYGYDVLDGLGIMDKITIKETKRKF